MKEPSDHRDAIVRYLDRRMGPAERADFESRLQKDEALQGEYVMYRDLLHQPPPTPAPDALTDPTYQAWMERKANYFPEKKLLFAIMALGICIVAALIYIIF